MEEKENLYFCFKSWFYDYAFAIKNMKEYAFLKTCSF